MAYPDQYPTIRDKGIYQIQNIDLGTFLERRDTGVVLRPSKKTSDNQKVSNLGHIALFLLSDANTHTR